MNTELLNEMIAMHGFTDEDGETLARHVNRTSAWAGEIIKVMYDAIELNRRSAAVLLPGERPEREESMRKWYLDLTSGRLDATFWQHQWLVGLIHIQRGVANTMMLAMLSRIQQAFLAKCLVSLNAQEAGRLYLAFHRASDVAGSVIAESHDSNYRNAMEEVSGYSYEMMKHALHMRVGTLIQGARRDIALLREKEKTQTA